MVTDSELVVRLRSIIRTADLQTTTATAVRRRLEADLSVDLFHRRIFIVEQIDNILHGHDDEGVNEVVVSECEMGESGLNDDVLKRDEEKAGQSENDSEEEGEEEKEKEKATAKRKKSVNTTSAKKRGGFPTLCALSPQLQKLVGVAELKRTEVTKKVWAYIKEHNLQNPKDGREILCDNGLRKIFRVRKIGMFEMTKELSKHILSLDEAKGPSVKSSQKESQVKLIRHEVLDIDDQLEKEEKRTNKGGIRDPCPISDALMKFTSESEISRTEIMKRLWQYIKEHKLQDPSDKKMVLCDDKLKELFEVDSFHCFTIMKLLNPHFIKTRD